MVIVIEYRKHLITAQEHLLNCVNPNRSKNGLRRFTVDSDSNDIEGIFTESLNTPPGNDWELHKVEIPELKLSKFNPYYN
jgi:hypothetical protein